MRMAFLLVSCMLAIDSARPQTVAQGERLRYFNTREGVLFRYPAGFVLKEGELAKTDDIGLGYMGPLRTAFVRDGGVRIATVEIPAGSFPKTDFVNAFFSVSVHDGLTATECEHFLSDQESVKTRRLKIHGLTFLGIDDAGAAMNHQFGATYYHTYVLQRCYEMALGVATAGYGAIDGITHVNDKAIMASLEAVARTLYILPRSSRRSTPSKARSSQASVQEPLPMLVSRR